jgi:hypothetical protein
MQDLSGEARFGPWVTSQAGGNMISSNERAMEGPGSLPADPLPDRSHQGDPEVGVTGKPRAVLERGVPYAPAPAVWRTVG